jgi:hypothetical protein
MIAEHCVELFTETCGGGIAYPKQTRLKDMDMAVPEAHGYNQALAVDYRRTVRDFDRGGREPVENDLPRHGKHATSMLTGEMEEGVLHGVAA